VANSINNALISKIGISIEVISDKTAKKTEYEILVGDTNRTRAGGEAEGLLSSYVGGGTDGLIASSDKHVLIYGGEEGGFGKAVTQFIQRLVPEGISGISTVELASRENFTVSTEEVRVMSYNILTWPTASRLDEIVTIIRACEPDVIGMQEAVPSALKSLKNLIGDTYDCVYLERDTASGESTPIWYNKHKYTLIESCSGWLSDTPDVMSKFPESEYVRVYVYVVLESKETGARFVHVDTHRDFERAQRKQTGKLLAHTSQFSYLPMFYTADWNFTPNSESYNVMHSAGYMDASVLTSNVHGSNTFVGSTSEIDFCFTSVLNTSVNSYRVIDEHPYSDTASDHYPIVIDLNIVK
jgi:endonuclease/exonuclease/phosphatase family metal-dependent hydrolase